ncbi:MAG: MOSC domain-containing protein [Caulobacteraceae bacterium]
MTGIIAALFRHPIKGFTPERRQSADLETGGAFPGDRLFAVEDGPSGFDPAAPAFVPKQRFAVLAKIAEVARARTLYDDEGGVLRASAAGANDLTAKLTTKRGKEAFARWLRELLGEAATGPLKVVDGGGHRFLDHPAGHVSIINLASVADLAARIGKPVDPLRFRANLYVEGWPAWIENGWTDRDLRLGSARARVFKPITRCAAPGVDPATAERDIDVVGELHRHFGHLLCGIYVQVTKDGTIAQGDAAEVV